MSDDMHGLVSGVREQKLGDALSQAVTLATSVLHVYDVADFDEDGGWLHFAGYVTVLGAPLPARDSEPPLKQQAREPAVAIGHPAGDRSADAGPGEARSMGSAVDALLQEPAVTC